jgi:hypothetical protein
VKTEKKIKEKKGRRSTLAHSSVLKWRHHELTPALQKEKIRREEQKNKLRDFQATQLP